VRRIGAYGVSGWIAAKNYSTLSSSHIADFPEGKLVKKYFNTALDMLNILEENKGKSGVYV
jgi:hypothetical protein